ncbi:MAG TPA: LPS assembly protein LptD [Phycisphaerae bacterium]|nr:LPS assembly protein LptD [Phycisphaerae bacterium]
MHGAAVVAAGAWAAGVWGVPVEPSPVATVHPTLAPTSAIPVPLEIAADETSVWRVNLEQRMLCRGHVRIGIGYRTMWAEEAAIFLTPTKEAGENTFDVAIYLKGNVRVAEGALSTSTVSSGPELLVTTRISQSAQLTGTPVPRSEEDSAVVKRGDQLRTEVMNRPIPAEYIPTITITSAEEALQNGWIAKGPNNRYIPGPEIRIATSGQAAATQPANRAPRPRPRVFIAFEPGSQPHGEQVGNEYVYVVPGAYLYWDANNGKPPLQFRAQQMVVFGLPPGEGAATQPAGGGALQSFRVTGVYMEGDVNLDSGDNVVRAERIYYDFRSQRAVMLDATMSTVDPTRHVPVYMRAQEIRQLARGEYAAKKVSFSTSEFYTPHYNIGASNIYLQDITPRVDQPGNADNPAPGEGIALGSTGTATGPTVYAYKVKDATINAEGVPIFYWPYIAGDTSKNDIPLRRLRVSNSRTFGPSVETDWDIFGLAGQHEPPGVRADLHLDYFGKRGPAGGVDGTWTTPDSQSVLKSYAMLDQGQDRLGRDETNVTPNQEARGRLSVQHQQDLGNGWSLNLEGSYVSDPTFLEQFYESEFDTNKEQETSAYLKHQGETDALTFLGKFSLFDFTATADKVDDQFTTEKKPEAKYWRIGDSILDTFTYYSESGVANLRTNITNYTPVQLGLLPTFLGPPAAYVPPNMKIRDYYRALGWTTSDVVRADTRQELDLPIDLGDLKVTPYVTGRVTAYDDAFPETESGNTTRLWGQVGLRAAMQFWKVYDDVQSTFFDVNGLRHIIEPQFVVFQTGTTVNRTDLQPFDYDVEGISRASGAQFAINQRWQTKRGGPGQWRTVDWLTLNVSVNQFWNQDPVNTLFFPYDVERGFIFPSRPELSQVRNSVAADGVWRAGERFRFIGEGNYNTDDNRLEQAAGGVAVDQTNNLSYFFGNRYIRELNTDEWTLAFDYQLTRKYEIIAAESYDFMLKDDILSSFTIVRKMPRFNAAVTVTYDANLADTTFVFTLWPEGFPELGIGNRGLANSVR